MVRKNSVEQAPIHYYVLVWADPDVAEVMVNWLRNSHLAEVVAQPGFLDAKVVVMADRSPEGKVGILSTYQVASSEHLQAYFASPEKKRFDKEGAQFAGRAKVQRFWGAPVVSLSSS